MLYIKEHYAVHKVIIMSVNFKSTHLLDFHQGFKTPTNSPKLNLSVGLQFNNFTHKMYVYHAACHKDMLRRVDW